MSISKISTQNSRLFRFIISEIPNSWKSSSTLVARFNFEEFPKKCDNITIMQYMNGFENTSHRTV